VTDRQNLVYMMAMEDLTAAANLLRPTWKSTKGVDGYVSVEIPPGLAIAAKAEAIKQSSRQPARVAARSRCAIDDGADSGC
jgi:transaldolase